MTYVSAEELEQARSAAELETWVASRIEEIAQQEGGTTAIRLLQGRCKELVEEVFPLGVWASQLQNADRVIIEPTIGSQNYDAVVRDTRGATPEIFYVEVTQAHLGESEHLRRLHLEQKGWAPGPLGEMIKIGTKATGLIVKAGRMLSSIEGLVRKTETLIEDAVKRKLHKNYPSPTRLLVAFEDFSVVKDPAIEPRLCAIVESVVGEQTSPFTHIYLVGMSKKLLIEWHTS